MTKIPAPPLACAIAAAKTVQHKNAPGAYPWHYETGLILQALWKMAVQLKDDGLKSYVKECADSLLDHDGSIKGYKTDEMNLDQINSGKILLELKAAYGGDRYDKALATLRDQLARQPRTAAGGFWHKKIYPYQMWLDGLYMQAPFAARYGLEYNDPDLVDDVCEQLVLMEEKARDPSNGLLYHAWDESKKQLWANPVHGRSPHSWGRAWGWYCMALADVLEMIGSSHSKYDKLAAIFKRTMETIISLRDETSGMWFQVLDQPGRPGNYLESSSSSMYCYALAKGTRLGILKGAQRDVGRAAFMAMSERYLSVDADGRGSLGGICKVAGLGGNPYRDGSFIYYINEPVVADDFKGVGPYIMAGLELKD